MQSVAPSAAPSRLLAGRAPSEGEMRIWRTRSGIRLLILAVLLQWIPLVEYLGLIIGALGTLQVIRGRRAFGPWHDRLVLCSVILFVGAGVSAIALDQAFTYSVDVMLYANLGSSAPDTALATYRGLAEGSLIIAIVIAGCYLLLAYHLEDAIGHRLLFAALAAQVAGSVAVFVLFLSPLIQQVVPGAFASSPPDATALRAMAAEISGPSALRLFDSIPAIIFAWAYTRAYRLIERGEVPPRIGAPASAPRRI